MIPQPRLWLRLALFALVVITAFFLGQRTAGAHTQAEQEAWMTMWEERSPFIIYFIPDNMIGLMAHWPEEDKEDLWSILLWDMKERHPCSKVMSTWEDSCVRVTATTHPPRTAVNRDMGSDVEQWRPLVEKYFASDKVATAMCIMKYESGGNTNAKNRRSTAAGLFQFLKSTWDKVVPREVTGGSYASGQVYIPEANVRAAAWLQANAGWTQWSVYKRCR